ncbi:uncharacterized protein LOC142312760 [Anomaloglossus baeobatrachus]|uniref:uncharacterized protein LOC142312760 n=1 Tax=Anomaloglossus baeobatrachus TaxID=238106 RepID=UPI003F4F998F
MDLGFVASVRGNSSPYPICDHLDHRTKSGGSPSFSKSSDATHQASGEKLWLSAEDTGPAVYRFPLNPDSQVFEQSSITSEPVNQFNNSIVGVFYGDKVSTPCKNDESLDPLGVDMALSKLQDAEVILNAVIQQKQAPPMWEISEINSGLEEHTPLDGSIPDLRCANDSESLLSASAQFAQWANVKHKDTGRPFLQPFRYHRQMSTSESQVTSVGPPRCSQIPALSPETGKIAGVP